MTFMNSDANIKQFEMLKFINENCSDDHVMSKMTIVLRRDKIEAPYYMIIKTRMSSCIDRPENGLIHAMDVINITRRHNLSEEAYDEIRSLIITSQDSELVKISKKEKELKMDLISRNDDEIIKLYENYRQLFEKIDSLID